MAVLRQRKDDKESCPLFNDYFQLREHSDENRLMIENNHTQVMSMISSAQSSHDGLSRSVKEIHKDVRTIAEKIDSANSLFEAWKMLPKLARTSIKVLTVAGGAAIALKGIIDLFRLIIG